MLIVSPAMVVLLSSSVPEHVTGPASMHSAHASRPSVSMGPVTVVLWSVDVPSIYTLLSWHVAPERSPVILSESTIVVFAKSAEPSSVKEWSWASCAIRFPLIF